MDGRIWTRASKNKKTIHSVKRRLLYIRTLHEPTDQLRIIFHLIPFGGGDLVSVSLVSCRMLCAMSRKKCQCIGNTDNQPTNQSNVWMSLCVRIHIATMQLCVPNEQNINEKNKNKAKATTATVQCSACCSQRKQWLNIHMNPSVWKPNEMEKMEPERERKKATSPMKWILRDIRSPHSAVHAFTLVHTYTHTQNIQQRTFGFFFSPRPKCIGVQIEYATHVAMYVVYAVQKGRKPIWIGNWPVLKFVHVVAAIAMRCFIKNTPYVSSWCVWVWKRNALQMNRRREREENNWLNKNRNVFMAVHAVQKGEIEWERKKMTPNRKSKTHRERKMSRLLRWNSKCECISIQKNWN